MKTISTTTEALCVADITHEWKIVARAAPWVWCGALAESRENRSFRAMAFPTPAAPPHISCVTGRGEGDRLTLYARLWPVGVKH